MNYWYAVTYAYGEHRINHGSTPNILARFRERSRARSRTPSGRVIPRTGHPTRHRPFGILSGGEVSEWLMVPLSKSGVRKHRGFESHPLRHSVPGRSAMLPPAERPAMRPRRGRLVA